MLNFYEKIQLNNAPVKQLRLQSLLFPMAFSSGMFHLNESAPIIPRSGLWLAPTSVRFTRTAESLVPPP